MELKDTVNLMLSDDYKDRFKAEYYQLKIRRDRLTDVIAKYQRGVLDFTPNSPIYLLNEQLRAMNHYLLDLERRAEIEGISTLRRKAMSNEMDMEDIEKRYREYLVRHIDAVIICYSLLTGKELVLHDYSKYEPVEFGAYLNYFYEERTEEVKKEFDLAWLHHIHNNPHHWNHWVLVDGEGIRALPMPDMCIDEMIADWASFAYQKKEPKDLLDFYESHKDKMLLEDSTRQKVEKRLMEMYEALKTRINENRQGEDNE